MNKDTSAKDLGPEEYRNAVNLVAVTDGVGVSARLENMLGMRETGMPVPVDAVCIGMWNYREKNKIYAFYSGSTDVIIEYDGFTDVGTVLMQNNLLDFQIGSPVIDAFLVENLLYFNDASHELRKINIDYAKTGALNSITDERLLTLIKTPPLRIVTSTRETDPVVTITRPRIRTTPLQFATRYIYEDDEYSVLSPFSEVSPAVDWDFEDNFLNFVRVRMAIDTSLAPIIRKVELIIRETNQGLWYIYDSFDPEQFTVDLGDGTKQLEYDLYLDRSGATLSTAEVATVAESIPRQSSAFAFMEDRTWAVSTLEEFDLEEDQWDGSISLTPDGSANANLDNNIYKPLFYKENSRYSWGVTFFDKFGRKTAPSVRSNMHKQVPNNFSAYQVNKSKSVPDQTGWILYNHPTQYQALPVMSGKPPSWAVKYQFSRTDNQTFTTWFKAKFLVMPLYDINPKTDEPDPTLAAQGVYLDNGYWYESINKKIRDYQDTAKNYSMPNYVDLVIPDGFPTPVDESSLIRFGFKVQPKAPYLGTDVADKETFSIIQVENGRIRIKGLYWIDIIQLWITDRDAITGFGFWNNSSPVQVPSNDESFLHFEVLNPINRTATPLFYEVGEVYDITNPGLDARAFQITHDPIQGDCYYSANQDHEEVFKFNANGTDHIIPKNSTGRNERNQFTVAWASQAPIIDRNRAGTFVEPPESTQDSLPEGQDTFLANLFARGVIVNIGDRSLQSGLFYKTASDSKGRPTVEVPVQKELHRGGQMRWSRTFVQDSLINGLSNYPEENKYNISFDRGDVTKLVASNERVLVAIHTRSITSLYINQRFINSGEGAAFLAQTDNVVGDDRKLLLNYGTSHPESVVLHDSKVYGFDSIMSEPWRRSQDGITRLALTYGMKTYFERKGEEIRRVQTLDPLAIVTVLGGYDQWLDMYILTFSKIEYVDNGTLITIEAETIGFSEKVKRWVSFYTFFPEYYSSIMNNLVSAKDQSFWRHMDTMDRNLFYGQFFNFSITIVAKESNDVPKLYQNLGMSTTEPWSLTCKTVDGKESLLTVDNFILRDNIYYAEFLRDKNTPASTLKVGQTPLLHGEKMIGETLEITLENDSSNRVVLDAIYVGYSPMTGHLLSQT